MARIALYRKYRPQDFSEVQGQEHIMRVLKNAVKTSQFSHAYIFCGPRGIGKTTVARVMAKAVNCQEVKEGNPCNKCASCQSINTQTALDIIEIDAASNRGIDEIRDLREKVKFSPSELKYKVFIIDEVHMLTKEAFNALLKTLEEPPSHALFIMATTEIHKIPATVISRCQRFDFKRIGLKALESGLTEITKKEGIKIQKDAISVIARASEGGFRDAVSILDQISMNAEDKIITETDVAELLGIIDRSNIQKLASTIEDGQEKESLEFLSNLLERGADIGQITKGLLTLYREKIKENVGNNSLVGKYVYAIETLSECNRNFRYALHPQLSLEVAVLKIISRHQSSDFGLQEEEEDISPRTDNSRESSVEMTNNKEGAGKDISKKNISVQKTEKKVLKEDKDNENLLENWSQVLFELKSKNHSIHAFVRESEPVVADTGEIHLLFPYKFHKERIEDRKNKQIVEKAIAKVCGSEYKVVCKLDKTRGRGDSGKDVQEKDTAGPKRNASLDEFLDVLGGELVTD